MKPVRSFACALMLGGAALFAQAPLNPTVTVLPQAAMPVPAECDGAVPPQIAREAPPPRLEPEPPAVVELPPQPAADVRSSLRDAHAAAVVRDRASFDAALTRAKALGSASAAERDVITVLDDAARLWDYQYSTPTGSFFDPTVQDGSLIRILSRYPGYEEAIRRQTIVDGSGTRFYPTRESIEFLLGIAGDRLGRAGVRVERTVEATPRTQPQPQAEPRPPRVAESKPQPKPAATAPSSGRTGARPTPQRPRVQPQPQPAVTEVAEEPPIPPGVVSTPATSTDVDLLPVTTTAVVDTAMTTFEPPPERGAMTEPETTTRAAAETERPARGRSIIMPLVLILIGVGVLIVLFRASSS